MPKITVAMISMNEENAVRKVIEDIKTVIAGLDAEILVVDISKDLNPEFAAAAGSSVVRQFPPQGATDAPWAGLYPKALAMSSSRSIAMTPIRRIASPSSPAWCLTARPTW